MSQRPRMKNRVLFSVVGLWLRLMIFHFGNTKLLNLRVDFGHFFVLQVEFDEELPMIRCAQGNLLSYLGAWPSP